MTSDQQPVTGTSGYQQAFHRIRAEYLEMPGVRLTPEQVQRLSGVDVLVCRIVLDDLVRAKFLRASPDGTYVRASESPARPALRAGLTTRPSESG
jgi:hypothetical protein